MIATRSHVCSISDSRWLETKTRDPALRRELAHELPDLADPRRIETVGRLVEDQHVRLAEQGLRDPEPLPHPERVRRDLVVEALGERDHRPRAPRSAPRAPAGSIREKCTRFSRPVR